MSPENLPSKEKTYRTYSTWSERRVPTDYDVAVRSTNYNIGEDYDGSVPRLLMADDTALSQWLREHREGSVIEGTYPDDFDGWTDPRQLTYEKYNQLMNDREIGIDTLYEQAEVLERGIEREDDPWLDFQLKGFLPLRYPAHGFQMLASYNAMVGPSSTISTAMSFQATDEIRRQERLSRRASQLEKAFPDKGFTEDEREIWEDHEMWQPLRKVLEELLAEYDWGESFFGTNLVLKPLFDELVLAEYSELFALNGSNLYAQVLENFYLDADRSQEIAVSVADHVIGIDDRNQETIQAIIDEWYPASRQAIAAFEPAFESMPPETMDFEDVLSSVDESYDSMLEELPVETPS